MSGGQKLWGVLGLLIRATGFCYTATVRMLGVETVAGALMTGRTLSNQRWHNIKNSEISYLIDAIERIRRFTHGFELIM